MQQSLVMMSGGLKIATCWEYWEKKSWMILPTFSSYNTGKYFFKLYDENDEVIIDERFPIDVNRSMNNEIQNYLTAEDVYKGDAIIFTM